MRTATKKKIKKLKSEFELDDDMNEMTGFNVPELIKTTVHRLTHPKGYKDFITKYTQRKLKRKKRSLDIKIVMVQFFQTLQDKWVLIE